MSEEHPQTAIAVAQHALGALHHVAHDHMVAQVGGRHVDLLLLSARVSRGRSEHSVPYQVLQLRIPLAVPLRLSVNRRDIYVHVGPVPILSTGDPGFDVVFTVCGVPAEVVTPALDGPTRAWMQQCGPDLAVGTDDAGALTFHHSVTLPSENTAHPLTPEKIHAAGLALRHLAEALERTYRARRAAIVAAQGEPFARRWEEQNREIIGAQPMRWLRWVLLGCLVVLVVVILAGTALFVDAVMDFVD